MHTLDDLGAPSGPKPVKLFLRTIPPGRSPLTAFMLDCAKPDKGENNVEGEDRFSVCEWSR